MVEVKPGVHSIDGLEHPLPGVGVVSYFVEEGPHDVTLIDTCFSTNLPILENYLRKAGHEIADVRRIVISHLHSDHSQSVNEVKKRSGAQILAHWADAAYLNKNPAYSGPPRQEELMKMIVHMHVRPEDVIKKFGTFEVEPIHVDRQLQDGEMIGSLQVIHTPGHTPGHISLFARNLRLVIGGDVLFKSVLGTEGLFIPPGSVSIDPNTGIISARRLSKLDFDILLLGHQDKPLLEKANQEIERIAFNGGMER